MSELGFIVLSPTSGRKSLSTPTLAIAAARAGAGGILDAENFSDASVVVVAFAQLQRHASTGTIGIRCRVDEAKIFESLALNADQTTIAILTAGVSSFQKEQLEEAIKLARQARLQVFVETIDLAEALLAQTLGVDAVIAKGHESAGRVGDTTSFVLVQQFVPTLKIPTWVQGGIGLHSAAAMAVAGAAGVVLDSQLYLCRDSEVSIDTKLRVERMDGTETTIVQSPNGQLIRGYLPTGELENLEAIVHIGQDACFAKSLADVGGTVAGVLDAIRDAIAAQREIASRIPILAAGSALAMSHGTKYPIVQGAMTRVSDTSDFALKVAEGGGLPFLALSLMRGPDIEKLMSETKEKLGQLPWGVGLLGFVPQQLRQEQWEIVNRYKPPFALIAGGRPDQAKTLEDGGTQTYLHVPSPLLLKSFIEMGSKRFIFEGKECGGHVGPRSSMVLWNSMIDVLLANIGPKDNPSAFHVLFAGGLHDDLSAAMVATLAAPLVARGIKIGVLVGTAYLFTREAVETGAIVKQFQDEALKCDQTVLLETGPGHSIRCIASPYKDTFDEQREELKRQNKSRDDVREELELMNLGRLRIASKGLSRGAGSELVALAPEQQWQQGMYMIGQVAALHDKLTTISKLHENISFGGQKLLANIATQPAASTVTEHRSEPVAIVGMSCLFPQANDMQTYWQNILHKVDAITEIPETHFKWQNYYDENPLARDKIVSKWGGFLQDVVFEPSRYGIPPSSLDSIDPVQVLVLEAARTALQDAGYSNRKYPRDKTSVILANAGHGPITALYSLRSMLGWKLADMDPAYRQVVEDDLPEWTEDSFAGYLGNVTAGRVANRFDLKGINFSIDAACASSLAALYVAVNDLRSHASDVVLLGAADTHNQPGDYLSFSKTHALSRDGRCKTFDASADGIAISEGIAMLVLKRLSDAERDGDRIYAVIKGIGGSSDGRDLSLTAPRPAGQMLALDRAYADAGVDPATVGLVEAHGTGTVAGDRAEVEALTKVFQQAGAEQQSCAIGSVKTNIGHSKAAAGLASIIKVAKALHHKVLPPTINVKTPNPACNFSDGPFYISTESRPWLAAQTGLPRRAGVSAFGFGGTNFHTVLEEYIPASTIDEAPAMVSWPAELLVWKARSSEQLLKVVSQTETLALKYQTELQDPKISATAHSKLFDIAAKLATRANEDANADVVLVIVATSLESLVAKIHQFKESCTDGASMTETGRGGACPLPLSKANAANGIHFSLSTKSTPVAFLFPGQGSQRLNMLRDLIWYFPELQQTLTEVNEKLALPLGASLSNFIYPTPTLNEDEKKRQSARLTDTAIAQPAIGACSVAMLRLLSSFGATADMVGGHSYGEYVALHAAGAISSDDLFHISAERGKILASCASKNPGAMAAVSCDPETAREVIKAFPNVYLANINTPKQCIISGASEGVESALKQFKQQDIPATKIPVSAAFHTPLMNDSQEPLASALRSITFKSPSITPWSNTTSQAYSLAPDSIVKVLEQHALQPVLFAEQIQSMHAAGARVFVEVGPGSVLTGLTQSTLKGRDFVAVHTESSAKNPLEQFLNVLAVLTVNGSAIDFRKLFWNRRREVSPPSIDVANTKKNQLLYRVNSVRMEKIGNHTTTNTSVALVPVEPKNKALSTGDRVQESTAAAPNGSSNGSSTNLAPSPQKPFSSPTNNGQQGNGSNGTNGSNGSYNATPKSTASARPALPSPAGRNRNDSGVERVMLEFQQSMLQMTNRFLETQQNVMLAYLQSNGKLPAQLTTTDYTTGLQSPTPVPMQQPQILATQPQQIYRPSMAFSESAAAESTPPDAAEPAVAYEASTTVESESCALNKEFLVESLYEIVSERTGYPREMLDPDLDLEADLGIDSIKRVEILNNFRKLLPESIQEQLESGIEKLAGTKTLQGVIDWILSLEVDGQAAVAPLTVGKSNAPLVSLEVGNIENLARGTVAVKDLPIAKEAIGSVSPSVLIVALRKGPAESVAKSLANSGLHVQILSPKEAIERDFADQAPIGNLIYFADCGLQSYFALVKKVETSIRAEVANGRRGSVISVTALGGHFATKPVAGLDLKVLADQAGIVGVTKSLAKEWLGVHAKAVDIPAGTQDDVLAATVAAELFADDKIVEIGLLNGLRITLDVAEAPSAVLPHRSKSEITSSSVILITGGARGITAEIAVDLATRYQPNIVIVGRLPKPTDREQAATVDLKSAKEIKAALIDQQRGNGVAVNVREVEKSYQHLLREREVRRTLSAIEAAGAKVKYYSVDVSDPVAFSKLIDSIYETSNVDGVIHGAGIIEDAFTKDKTQESFERVFSTKVNSAITLGNKLRLDTLKFLYFFSSVVGRTGNAGQCDYVAANEALNKIAVLLNQRSSARIASLMWGPWQAGMAPPELEEVFALHGWSMIKPQDGRASFHEELLLDAGNQPEVLLVGKLRKSEKPSTDSINPSGVLVHNASVQSVNPSTLALTVTTQEHIYLQDHKFDGIPVMPMAVALELMLEAAQALHPDQRVVSISNLDIPAGIVFHAGKKDLLITTVADTNQSGQVSISLNAAGSVPKPHFRCKAQFADAPYATPAQVLTALGHDIPSVLNLSYIADNTRGLPQPKDVYGTWLFHGPIFQGMSSVLHLAPNGVSGEVTGCSPERFVTTANSSQWILDPVLLDSAMQLAGVWARHHRDVTVLPAGFKSMRFFRPLGSVKATARIFLSEQSATELLCDLAIYNQQGDLALLIEGLGGIASKAFNRFAAQAPVRELV